MLKANSFLAEIVNAENEVVMRRQNSDGQSSDKSPSWCYWRASVIAQFCSGPGLSIQDRSNVHFRLGLRLVQTT